MLNEIIREMTSLPDKPGVGGGASLNPLTWNCEHCQHENDMEDPCCEVCGDLQGGTTLQRRMVNDVLVDCARLRASWNHLAPRLGAEDTHREKKKARLKETDPLKYQIIQVNPNPIAL